MSDKSASPLRALRAASAVALAVALVALGGWAIAAQDKYTLQVPNGLPFSDFKGYENWEVVAVSQTDDLLKVMVHEKELGKPDPDWPQWYAEHMTRTFREAGYRISPASTA
jgi:hypothetical protein